MRIVAVRERTIELSSATRNSSISFDAMTASVIAVHTDASKDGKPLIGLAFDSIGRYGAWRPAARAFHSAARCRRSERLRRWQRRHRPASRLGRPDEGREAGWPRRALGRGRIARRSAVGSCRQGRGRAAVEPAGETARQRECQRQDRGLCQRWPLPRFERRRRPLRRRPPRHRPGPSPLQDQDRRRELGRRHRAHRSRLRPAWSAA